MDGYVSDTWRHILDATRYGGDQSSQLLFYGSFFYLPAPFRSNNSPEPPQICIHKAHGIDPFFVVSCGGDFVRRLNRFQRSMSPTEPDPGALPARLSWSGFNGHWVLAATEVIIHSRSQFPSCRSKPDGNGGRFCPLRVLCRSGRSQSPFFPSIST